MLRFLSLLAKACVVLLAVAAGYVCSPFWAAWSIREAVTQGDAAYLESRVHWPAVRETMRQSMLRTALDLPDHGVVQASLEPPAPRRSVFTRIKARIKGYASRRVVDRMVSSYITPAGLPALYNARRVQRSLAASAIADPADPIERFAQVWSRITRAEFISLTTFAIEIRDQFDASSSYSATLELKGDRWILTALSLRSSTQAVPVASAR